MFKKFSSGTLIILIVVLGGLALFNKFYLSKKSESTFNDEFVSMDTSLITQIFIYPKAEKEKELIFTRQPKGWELQCGKVKTEADTAAVRNLIGNFTNIKSKALAGTDKSSWKELQIDDSSGTRVRILTSGNKTYELVVGKFGYDANSRNGTSYIRHADEESVYAIDGFISFTVSMPFNNWRNKVFIKGNKENWNSLTFSYPGDSSFVLARQQDTWLLNGIPADSEKVEHYLNSLTAMQSSSFVDAYSPASTPAYLLSIQGNNQPGPIHVVAYPADSSQKFILHSSLNNDAYFSDGESHLAERIFVSRKSLERRLN